MKKYFSLMAVAVVALVMLSACNETTETPSNLAEGYWYNAAEDYGWIVCPEGEYEMSLVLRTYKRTEEGIAMDLAEMGRLTYSNSRHTRGDITMQYDEWNIHNYPFEIQEDEMLVKVQKEKKSFVKQPAVADAPASLEGVWKMSYSATDIADITVTAIVRSNEQCSIIYEQNMLGELVETDTLQTFLHYSPAAGMGGIESVMLRESSISRLPIRRDPASPAMSDLLLFRLTSATTLQLLLPDEMGVEFVFTKQ